MAINAYFSGENISIEKVFMMPLIFTIFQTVEYREENLFLSNSRKW